MEIYNWSHELEGEAIQFLKSRYATSMFLLSNLTDQGSKLNDQPNSGNFKIIKNKNQIISVFCLSRRGNLLISSLLEHDVSKLIINECLKESIPIKGILGEWNCAEIIWKQLLNLKIITTCTFHSNEILYQLSSIPISDQNSKVRLLEEHDFDQWLPIRKAYTKEEGLTNDLSDSEIKNYFIRYAKMNEYWGYFQDSNLIATTSLNAQALDIGQVGGVYTLPPFRNRGISKEIMKQMFNDCVKIHKLNKMILFTGENNLAAQRVYETLGFQKIGRFGIFFS